MFGKGTSGGLLAALFSVAPFLVAPKGCDAIVGKDPPACGGLAGTPCPQGEFCDFAAEARCGVVGETGLCSPIPDECSVVEDPVCGCDDRTYASACQARMAGVSVASQEPCSTGLGAECGGLMGASCPVD